MSFIDIAMYLAEGVGVDAHALSRREVVDAPPAHLQKDEGDEESPERYTTIAVGADAYMDISQIGEPRGSSPCLLRVPRPIVAPSFLSPERSEENTYGHEGPPYLDEVVTDVHLVIVDGRLLEPQQVGRHQRCGTEHT